MGYIKRYGTIYIKASFHKNLLTYYFFLYNIPVLVKSTSVADRRYSSCMNLKSYRDRESMKSYSSVGNMFP